MELNSNQIQEIIPHRYPFLLVDRITDFEPGDVLTLETTMTRTFGKVGIGTAVAKVGDEIAATAELTFAIG